MRRSIKTRYCGEIQWNWKNFIEGRALDTGKSYVNRVKRCFISLISLIIIDVENKNCVDVVVDEHCRQGVKHPEWSALFKMIFKISILNC